ncbi:TPA: hypothetical protein U0J99_000690 [Streptococcus suis]|nr:hypothetical protein [Streptococcus suis]
MKNKSLKSYLSIPAVLLAFLATNAASADEVSIITDSTTSLYPVESNLISLPNSENSLESSPLNSATDTIYFEDSNSMASDSTITDSIVYVDDSQYEYFNSIFETEKMSTIDSYVTKKNPIKVANEITSPIDIKLQEGVAINYFEGATEDSNSNYQSIQRLTQDIEKESRELLEVGSRYPEIANIANISGVDESRIFKGYNNPQEKWESIASIELKDLRTKYQPKITYDYAGYTSIIYGDFGLVPKNYLGMGYEYNFKTYRSGEVISIDDIILDRKQLEEQVGVYNDLVRTYRYNDSDEYISKIAEESVLFTNNGVYVIVHHGMGAHYFENMGIRVGNNILKSSVRRMLQIDREDIFKGIIDSENMNDNDKDDELFSLDSGDLVDGTKAVYTWGKIYDFNHIGKHTDLSSIEVDKYMIDDRYLKVSSNFETTTTVGTVLRVVNVFSDVKELAAITYDMGTEDISNVSTIEDEDDSELFKDIKTYKKSIANLDKKKAEVKSADTVNSEGYVFGFIHKLWDFLADKGSELVATAVTAGVLGPLAPLLGFAVSFGVGVAATFLWNSKLVKNFIMKSISKISEWFTLGIDKLMKFFKR